ncbi:MAG: GNAT family N-acetyltransferase [Candidatus Thermoplasmatota archaeon]
MFRLRGHLRRDTPEIVELVAGTFAEPYPEAIWSELSAHWPDGFIVADVDGRVGGFLVAVRDTDVSARILLLAVQPHLRNRGMGKLLLREFLKRCAALGLRTVSLEVRVANTQAIRFYEGMGFQVVAHLPHFYTDGSDGFQMCLWM